MGLRLLIVFCVLFLFISCGDQQESKSYKNIYDDLGNELSLTKDINRIISLAPNLTEIIFHIGCGDKLVGVTRFCDYPQETKEKEIVGDMLNVNFEKIVELNPDLVFITVEGNTKLTFDRLKSLGINVFVTNPRNIQGIKKSIKDLSLIFNKVQIADSVLKDIEFRLQNVKKLKLKNTSGLFIVSLNPLMVAGKNTFINEILESVNIRNIASNLNANYPVISREDLIIQNPEILILSSLEKENLQEIIRHYPEWKNIKAIKENKVIFVDENIFFRPGPRFILAVEFLASELKKFG